MNSREKTLIAIMHAGFDKSALSFSKLTQRPVEVIGTESKIIHPASSLTITEESGDLFILITEVIGDIAGKSYLIFSTEEIMEVLKSINLSSTNEELHEAFLMEIDNIISASVISELSNKLSLKIYGDVPRLLKFHADELQRFLTDEMKEDDSSSLILSNTTFRFDNKENVHPQFIWKLNSKVFELIQDESIQV